VREGERFDQLQPMSVEPDVAVDICVLHEDEEFIILSKPAPLPVHASGRYNRNTLRNILNLVWFPCRPHIVHRLDANTSGVMVLCKRKRVATIVQKQFENRLVGKTYLAKVHGHPSADKLLCEASIAREAGDGGIYLIDTDGHEASTAFEVLQRFEDGTSLVRAFPRTGRTNQIRAHLWHLGFPIVGDPAYLQAGQLGSSHTLLPSDPPMCLHSESIVFRDADRKEQKFEAPAPAWAAH
jgi:RluA family pseudouridine synthase